MKLLLVEDEIKTAQSLQQGLSENHFETDLAYDGETGFMLAQNTAYDLIITDIIMPRVNGLEFCRRLRGSGNQTPIIMLTAMGLTSDKISGFEAGTDDYIVKPFEFVELLARIKSVLKRSTQNFAIEKDIHCFDLTINSETKTVRRSGKAILLTAKEFALLEYFMRNKNRVISKTELAEKVWDLNFDTGTNIIEVYMSYLRNKVDKDFDRKLIQTRVGMGYMMQDR
jgi:two-component system copper resistance phosphate regulon response regulator CusR